MTLQDCKVAHEDCLAQLHATGSFLFCRTQPSGSAWVCGLPLEPTVSSVWRSPCRTCGKTQLSHVGLDQSFPRNHSCVVSSLTTLDAGMMEKQRTHWSRTYINWPMSALLIQGNIMVWQLVLRTNWPYFVSSPIPFKRSMITKVQSVYSFP